jgi:hypothetical protein
MNFETTEIQYLNILRKKNDEIETSRAMQYFQCFNLQFPPKKLFVIFPQNILTEELYWRFMDDLIEKIVIATHTSVHLRGSIIVDYINNIIKKILSISELDQVHNSLPKIFNKIIDNNLITCDQYMINFMQNHAQHTVDSMTIEDFYPEFIYKYITTQHQNFQSEYATKANEILSNMDDFFKDRLKLHFEYLVDTAPGYIENVVKDKWMNDLIPSQLQIYENKLKAEIETRLSQIEISNVLQFDFLSYKKEIKYQLKSRINQDLEHLDLKIQNSINIHELIHNSYQKLYSFILWKYEKIKNGYQIWQKPANVQIEAIFDEQTPTPIKPQLKTSLQFINHESELPKPENIDLKRENSHKRNNLSKNNDPLPHSFIRHHRKRSLHQEKVQTQCGDASRKKITKFQKKLLFFGKHAQRRRLKTSNNRDNIHDEKSTIKTISAVLSNNITTQKKFCKTTYFQFEHMQKFAFKYQHGENSFEEICEKL